MGHDESNGGNARCVFLSVRQWTCRQFYPRSGPKHWCDACIAEAAAEQDRDTSGDGTGDSE